ASFLEGRTTAGMLGGAHAPGLIMGPVDAKIDSGQWMDLMQPGAVSAEFYSASSWKTDLFVGKPLEINGKSASVRVITKNAQAFGASLMYTSMENARFFGNVPPSKVSIIIVDLAEDADKEAVMQQIDTAFPTLRAWNPDDLRRKTT